MMNHAPQHHGMQQQHHNNMQHHNNNGGGGNQSEKELASKLIQASNKRFYIDVKENYRGRFCKIAEVLPNGTKNRIIMAMSTAKQFSTYLDEFCDFYTKKSAEASAESKDDETLVTHQTEKDNRRYYFDYKHNRRGYFLRVTMTVLREGPRVQIAIPANAMVDFRNDLNALLTEFDCPDAEKDFKLPDPRSIKAENKVFYFDVGVNRRGQYLRISETFSGGNYRNQVRSAFRTAITIPHKAWSQFAKCIEEIAAEAAAAEAEAAAEAAEKKEEEPQKEVGAGEGGTEGVKTAGEGEKVSVSVEEVKVETVETA